MKLPVRQALKYVPEIFLGLFVLSVLPVIVILIPLGAETFGKFMSGPSDYLKILSENPAPPLMGLAFFVFVVFMTIRFWSQFSLIWAVARKMILEALNRRVAVVLLLFFIIMMPSLPFILKTDGTLKSHVQIIFTYALALGKYLLCFLAIFLSTASLCEEVEYKQIHTTDTKPLPRWAYLAGKWFGVVVMNTVLLVCMAASVYGIVRYLSRQQEYPTLSREEAARKNMEARQVYEEVLVTRRTFHREIPNVAKQVESELARLRKENAFPEGMTADTYRTTLATNFHKQSQTVGPLSDLGWRFTGLKPEEKGRVFIRFKIEKASASRGDQKFIPGVWLLFDPETKTVFQGPGRRWPLRSFQEIWAPASLIAKDGTLLLGFRNLDPEMSVTFTLKDGLEVLQKTGPFWPNLFRSLIVIECYIALLAAIGVMAGSLLSFPVATLLAFFIFGMGLISPFFQTMFREDQVVIIKDMTVVKPGDRTPIKKHITNAINTVVEGFLKVVFAVLPGFSKYNPVPDMVSGRMVPWSLVARATFWFLLIRGGLVALIGILCFRRRELARVQV